MNADPADRLVLYARLAGACYLAIIALGMFGEVAVRGALTVSGDANATASAIVASPTLWRLGIAGDLLMHVLDVPVMVVFYLLLKPISRILAWTSTAFNVVQTAVLVANKATLIVPILLLQDAGYLRAFSPDQLHTLAYVAIKAHGYGFGVGLIFFGFTCLIRGYLMTKSAYFPRILGVLIVVAGLSYLANSFALLIAPALADALFPMVLVPAFIGELAVALWLLVKGVKTLPRAATALR